MIWKKVGGQWKKVTVYNKVNGQWIKSNNIKLKHNGQWVDAQSVSLVNDALDIVKLYKSGVAKITYDEVSNIGTMTLSELGTANYVYARMSTKVPGMLKIDPVAGQEYQISIDIKTSRAGIVSVEALHWGQKITSTGTSDWTTITMSNTIASGDISDSLQIAFNDTAQVGDTIQIKLDTIKFERRVVTL